jgi:hypothetical protein
MFAFQLISAAAFVFFAIKMILQFDRIIFFGSPKEWSEKAGNVTKGVIYANTTAMLPNQKESAYLHIPTFFSGIVFHIGIFTSILLFFCSFFSFFYDFLLFLPWLGFLLSSCLALAGLIGLTLFVKRCFSKSLRYYSSLDDFISNFLSSLFILASALFVWKWKIPAVNISYYLAVSILLIYIPFGKLKHFLYYFAARYHLGFFYGWRNVWPPYPRKKI